MWLALDIGNSAAKGGFFDGDALLHPFRVPWSAGEPAASWEATFEAHLRDRPVTRAGVASVVPTATPRVQALLGRLAQVEAEVIHHQMRLPFALAYETPHTLGVDRLAAAAAAWTRYGPDRAVVALDAGTAVTYDVVDRSGVFRGGAIGAGPELMRQALAHGTAQLPPVPLEQPVTPVGRTTQEAIQAGLMYAFIDSVRGMLDRISASLGEPPVVVATGGWSLFLKERLDALDHVDPHLVLRGVRALMLLNGTP
jgi:type III pantothenate kinase